ncbi:MAG: hypothetical protein IT178_01780 [Acidobacteria bacterium]|nr:hypothetical protein [Acidobacteriota bacterium]
MRSSTSSSDVSTPADWMAAARRLLMHAVLVGLAFLVIGEVWFRMPGTTKLLVFDFDELRGSKLAAPQRRGMGLGNFSRLSPPIGINADGYRNGPIDWTQPTVLAAGSSEMLGPGVEDSEVWTAVASAKLTHDLGHPITVVNAGSAGYGPYQHAVTVRLFLEHHPAPRAIVVRASVTDRRFGPLSAAEIEAARQQKVYSQAIKAVSEFLPFLVNRAQAQVVAIRNTFRLPGPGSNDAPVHEAPAVADVMWETHGRWWREITDMATSRGIPLVFFVDGGDGSPSAGRLAELLRTHLGSEPGVQVVLFDGDATGLTGLSDVERRHRFAEEFTLGYDPHGNAALHARMASFLEPTLAGILSTPPHRR